MPNATVDGVTISYGDGGGDSTPVVLLHAFPFNSQMWEPQLQGLGDRFRFVTPDLAGFGASDAPSNPEDYSMDRFADQVKAVIDALGATEVILGGLSMGGYVALAFMRRYPDVVKALVLADTRAEADPPEGKDKRTSQQELVRNEGTAGLIETLSGALLSESTRTNSPEVVARAKELMKNPDAGFVGALEAMKNRPDSTDGLSKIGVPTLIIVGENDGVTPPDAARKLHEHIGGSRLVVIPDSGHISNLEAPEAFNAAFGEFLGSL
ncbi:MAG TPA: alpha/beta fold hydrolase [Actinomycetota bacterium]|nr:alpha/beta fold hydrolase [Actinomycetota bacterium]